MKQYKLLWKKLRQIRRAKDITQLEAAKMLGVSVQTFNYWEKGTSSPRPQNLVKLVELFGEQVYGVQVYREC